MREVFRAQTICSSDWVGFAFQLVSIGFWIVTQVPQFIDNWKNGSAEALSPIFLADWLLGDSCNLLGCLLTGTQLPLTTGTAWYFVTCDIIMIVQYIYYAAKNARERRKRSRRRKRGLIQAAAAVGEQYLLEYDTLNAEASQAIAMEQERVPTVHSAPNMLSLARENNMADTGWQVHGLEPSSRSQVLPDDLDASNEASTSQQFINETTSGITPDSGARSTGASLRLAQIIVFGTGVVVTLLVVWMWMIQSGRDNAVLYTIKGLIVKPVDDQGCAGSTHGLRNCMVSEEMSLQAAMQEDKRLPLCPEKQLPKWTRECASVYTCGTCLMVHVATSIESEVPPPTWIRPCITVDLSEAYQWICRKFI